MKRTLLCAGSRAIIDAIAPAPPEETQLALANAKKPRIQVQSEIGQVLTAQVVPS